MNNTDLLEILYHLNPAECSYQEWCDVGMALKHEGYAADDWDKWSAMDTGRYHRGECLKKWRSFNGSGSPVTGGTIFHLAVEHGWEPNRGGHELDWDSVIDQDGIVVDTNWIEDKELHTPKGWDPGKQLTTYLQTLFEPGEIVGFVTKSWKRKEEGKEEKYIPKDRGVYNRTAGQLIEELASAGKDIGSVVGDYDAEGGAWIRFNPLDGNGVRNENVTEYRYALVESDNMPLERQNALIRELELPVAVLVHSGGKSLHAIVRVDAGDYAEYRKRVDYLYEICEKNGMTIDKQNRNPSRLSRMPGCVRGKQKQYIVDTNIGKGSWQEWREWIESVNDNLPDIENLAEQWETIPDLAPSLIDGILRKGHKMLISGPSKAGKSYLLIELTIAIAEGKQWLQWQCAKGRVLYVNLELDGTSCLHRFRDVYTSLGWKPDHLSNIDIWNLRGKSVPMDKLAPKLIRRAAKKNCQAIIIDPIYKVITGDENSADQMAKFCNQFDLVCTELGCAVIYCHHHSKGFQGMKKAIDRASGSGVFARDPDAVLDLIELETTPELMTQQENKGVCRVCREYLDAHWKWQDDLSEDDLLNRNRLVPYCDNSLDEWQKKTLHKLIDREVEEVNAMTAWRIEGTLREFPKFDPVNLWFRHPIHYSDASGALQDVQAGIEKTPFEVRKEAAKAKRERERTDKINAFTVGFEGLEENGEVVAEELASQMGCTSQTILSWLGDGKKKIKELAEQFEKTRTDGKEQVRIRRKTKGGGGAPDLKT